MKTKIFNQLKIAVLGDIHLGHGTTSTSYVTGNLRALLPDNGLFASLDMIILEGDVFDKALYLHNESFTPIHSWIMDLLILCKKHNVLLRILEGTPTHDWGQSSLFVEINRNVGIGADVKYVPTLSVEYIESLDTHILYVPDEWDLDPMDTYKKACLLLKEHGIKQFDFIVMHGAFEYQLPSHITVPTHDSKLWQELVKYYILVGHIHTRSVVDKIVATGSTDRLSHGEEEPKGYSLITVTNGHPELQFIENKNAMIYRTINVSGLSLEEGQSKVRAVVAETVRYSRLRIFGDDASTVNALLSYFSSENPDYYWSKKTEDPNKKRKAVELTLTKQYASVDIRPENIIKLVIDRMREVGVREELIRRAVALLEKEL